MRRHGTLSIPRRQKSTRPKPPPRVPVLVELHADGWVEVYAPKHVDVRIVQRLDVGDEDAWDAHLQDAIIDINLPKRYREIHVPNLSRAAGQVKKRTVDDELRRLARLDLLREIQEVNIP